MESKIHTIEKHKDAYVKIRIIESLDELTLGLKLLKEDLVKFCKQSVLILEGRYKCISSYKLGKNS